MSLFVSSICAAQDLECGDLLNIYGEKPEQLTFVDCTEGAGQTILEARYSVADSEAVEAFLVENYGLEKLKFVCCGWEPTGSRSGWIKNEKLLELNPNYVLSITMYGNAEKKNSDGEFVIETDRSNVEFTVVVTLLDI